MVQDPPIRSGGVSKPGTGFEGEGATVEQVGSGRIRGPSRRMFFSRKLEGLPSFGVTTAKARVI